MSEFSQALNEGVLLPRDENKPLTQEQTAWLDKQVNELFKYSQMRLHHAGDKDATGYNDRGYSGSYEQLYDECIREGRDSGARYKADREKGEYHDGEYYVGRPHIQMFTGAHIAEIAFGRMDYDHKKNAELSTAIPELDKDTRIVIKTVEEASQLPAFKGARKELMQITDIERSSQDSNYDYSRPKDEKRVVLVYDKSGELKRAFGATIELDFKHDYDRNTKAIGEQFIKGEIDKAEWEKQLASSAFYTDHHREPENIRLHMHHSYNPALKTIEDVSKKKLELPLDQGKPFGPEFQNGHRVLPSYRERAFVPSSKQAQQFIDAIEDANLVQHQSRPVGISDEVLTAAVGAAKLRAPENIPLVASAKDRSTEMAV